MSDLSKYCVHIGRKVQKEAVSPFQIMLYAYRAVMAVGVGILYDFPILYFVLLATNVYVFNLYPQSLISCESL